MDDFINVLRDFPWASISPLICWMVHKISKTRSITAGDGHNDKQAMITSCQLLPSSRKSSTYFQLLLLSNIVILI